MQQVERPSVALEWWRESGALAALIPAIAEAPDARFVALDHLPIGRGDDEPGRTLDRLAMLFFGAEPSAVTRAVRELRMANSQQGWIVAMARGAHDVLPAIDAVVASREATPAEVRRWVAALGRTRSPSFFSLVAAHWRARAQDDPTPEAVAALDRVHVCADRASHAAYHEPVEIGDLAVDGEDLAAAGVPPGPRLGVTLRALLEWVLEDPERNVRARLLERVAEGHAAP